MCKSRKVRGIVVVGVAVLFAGYASAQNYPNRPVRIVTAGVGGGNDFVSRLLAQGLTGALGQPVVVHNRPSGPIPMETVANALPDGYTLLAYGSAVWALQLLRSDTSFKAEKDFAPVSMVDRSPLAIIVHPSLPINSVKDLIAYAKAKPGALNYSTGASGSLSHLAPELFKSIAGVSMTRIPYSSGSAETTDLLSGRVQLSFNAGSMVPHIKSGKMKAIAVTSLQPSPLYPGLPTVAASGLAGFEAISVTGLYAPAKTPDAIIRRLNQEVVRYFGMPEPKEQLLNGIGTEAISSTPEALGAFIKTSLSVWGKVIKDAGIKAD
jgi:tripartite-type tricarboxylate transporter receptor subunit TctC